MKKFGAKFWICVTSIILSIFMVALVCLGVALSASNGKIDVLRTDLNVAGEKLEALESENEAAKTEIDAQQSTQALTDQEVERLKAECEQLKNNLKQSMTEQDSAEERIKALENSNQSPVETTNDRKKTTLGRRSHSTGCRTCWHQWCVCLPWYALYRDNRIYSIARVLLGSDNALPHSKP